MTKIMLVDDEKSMRKLVERIVRADGYDYCEAVDGIGAIATFHEEDPDLLILDVMLPKLDGFQVCRRLRDAGAVIPILFLSAKNDIVDKGAGFSAGGDDYITKPFSTQELSLRIEAHLKYYGRLTARQDDPLNVGGFVFDERRHEVNINGRVVDLTPKEYQILHLLASSPGNVFTREQLTEAVWGKEYLGESSSVPVLVRRIREKIEPDPSNPRYLQTVWRVGYKFTED